MLSNANVQFIVDSAVYGFSVISEIMEIFLGRMNVQPVHFDNPSQPLQIALVVRFGESEYQIEKIFISDKDIISEQVFIYEWKSASKCYVPIDDLGSPEITGSSLTEMVKGSIHIWKHDDYLKILVEKPNQIKIKLPRLMERIGDIDSMFSEINENNSPEQADQKFCESAADPNKMVTIQKSETENPSFQIDEAVIRYVALRVKKNTLDQKVKQGMTDSESAQELSFHELIQLFREASKLEEKRSQYDDLHAGIDQLERVTAKMEDDLKTELHTLNIQMNEKRPWALKVSEYEKELELHHRELVRLQKTQEKQKHTLEQGLQDKIRLEFLERWIEEHKTYVDEERSEIERIQQLVCPGCKQIIGEDQKDQLKKKIQDRIDTFNEKIFQYQIEINEIRHAMDKLRGTYSELEKEIKQQPAVWHQYYVTEHRLQIARQYEKEYQALKEQSERVKMTLNSRSFARREQMAIDELRKQLQANGYHPSLLRAVYQKISEKLDQPVSGKNIPDGQCHISEGDQERFHILEKKEAVKNHLASLRNYFPDGMTPEDLFQSRSMDELIRNATHIITNKRMDSGSVIRNHNKYQHASSEPYRHETKRHSTVKIRNEIIDALKKLREDLAAISAISGEPVRERLLKAIGTFRVAVARDLMSWIAGETYGTWIIIEELPDGGASLALKRRSEIIFPHQWPEPVRTCAGLCLKITDSMAGIGDESIEGFILFGDVPFLLHESHFIDKIRTLFTEVMIWMDKKIIFTPYSPNPAEEGIDYKINYGNGGITVTIPERPAI